jgi:hypothetical protein
VARPRLPIGTHGAITALTLPDGRVEVRARYRDGDGKTRQVSVRAASRSAATTELKRRLAARLTERTPVSASRSIRWCEA